MAVASLTEQQTALATATLYELVPEVFDNIFTSMPLLVRLMSKNRVILDGGKDVRQPFIYDKLPGGFYTGSGPFDTSSKETLTNFRFTWKKQYSNVNITDDVAGQNVGDKAVIDLVSLKMEEAEMKIKDDLAGAIFSDGTDTSKHEGLAAIADDNTNVNTYGGVTRDSSVQGTAAKGSYDGTGGVTSISLIRSAIGSVTIGNKRPDLGITTQTVWDKLVDRVQPSQQFVSPDLAAVGFEGFRLMGCDFVVDSNCQSGRCYLLTTDTLKLYIASKRNFYFTGWKQAQNNPDDVGQLILWSALACGAPRQNRQIRALT